MLSPHEFATLMLVRQAPDQLDMNRAELDALLERQLVMLEHCAAGERRARLTDKGRVFLDALHRDGALPEPEDVEEKYGVRCIEQGALPVRHAGGQHAGERVEEGG
ncbi:hypothetical protein NUV25_03580 [Burkholderia pseudomultivorans]|uniref:hypothetical protein n=1 Tax=Burkholderia pseudomultivorans TaxID=1207504 RepID=UPI0028741135|nr:hypothetical protein [Burkholderia pseudomultivorans]MDS0856779.1 hypothetical protein [Burkholderia pseudomultivorans]